MLPFPYLKSILKSVWVRPSSTSIKARKHYIVARDLRAESAFFARRLNFRRSFKSQKIYNQFLNL